MRERASFVRYYYCALLLSGTFGAPSGRQSRLDILLIHKGGGRGFSRASGPLLRLSGLAAPSQAVFVSSRGGRPALLPGRTLLAVVRMLRLHHGGHYAIWVIPAGARLSTEPIDQSRATQLSCFVWRELNSTRRWRRWCSHEHRHRNGRAPPPRSNPLPRRCAHKELPELPGTT